MSAASKKIKPEPTIYKLFVDNKFIAQFVGKPPRHILIMARDLRGISLKPPCPVPIKKKPLIDNETNKK